MVSDCAMWSKQQINDPVNSNLITQIKRFIFKLDQDYLNFMEVIKLYVKGILRRRS